MQRIYRLGSLVGFAMVILLVSAIFVAPAFAAIPRTEIAKRLCERQKSLGKRLSIQLIDPALCADTPPAPSPALTFTADPESIQEGGSSMLTWDSTDATSCEASDGWSGTKTVDGALSVSPTVTTTYSLTCSGNGNITRSATVTVVDVPNPPTLTLVKTVTNNSGGQASANDFQAKIDGANVTWSAAHVVTVGAHTASEVEVFGYDAGDWGGDCAANGTITLAEGEDKTCTITNDDMPGTLHVVKVVTNDNGGTATTSNFSFGVNGLATTTFEVDGQNDLTLNAGTYTITETATSTYAVSYDNCTNVVISNGGSATCTITNNDVAATPIPTVILTADPTSVAAGGTTTLTWSSTGATSCVAFLGWTGDKALSGSEIVTVNATTTYQLDCTGAGGVGSDDAVVNVTPVAAGHLIVDKVTLPAADATEFTISASGTGVITGGAAGTVTDATSKDYEVAAGTYSVAETVPAGWEESSNTCIGVVVAAGETKNCVITNSKLPMLTVTKVVTNDDDGTKVVADFPLFIDAIGVVSGVQNVSTIGAHTVSETGSAGYTAVISGDCAADGTITLVAGDVKSCTITNDDNPIIAGLLITEVLYDVDTTTQGAEGTNEWVEIHNGTDASVDLSGYKVRDNSGAGDILPAGTIVPAGKFLFITEDATTESFWTIPADAINVVLGNSIGGNGLSNTGDRMQLVNLAGAVVDAVGWGSDIAVFATGAPAATEGKSIARTPITTDTNTGADWAENATPTPGL